MLSATSAGVLFMATTSLTSLVRAATDGLLHAAAAARDCVSAAAAREGTLSDRFGILVSGSAGQLEPTAWQSILADARDDPEASARGERIAARFAQDL